MVKVIEVKSRDVHRSPGIWLTAEENPGKPQVGDPRLKWDPFPPNEVGRVPQHVRKGEERKEGKDGVGYFTCNAYYSLHYPV